jgi:hypothetical protein
VKVGRDDPSLAPAAGVTLIAELDRVLGVVETIDAHVGPIKVRRQGLSAGQLVVSMTETMLAGGDYKCDLDHARHDVAGAVLRAVPQAPSLIARSVAALPEGLGRPRVRADSGVLRQGRG